MSSILEEVIRLHAGVITFLLSGLLTIGIRSTGFIHHEAEEAWDGGTDRKFSGVGAPGFHCVSFHSLRAE